MKKKLLTLGLICAGLLCFAQSGVNNLSFENWTVTGTPNPVGFNALGASQMTVGAQHLNSYARVTSNGQIGSSPTATGAMELGSVVGITPYDGVPYTLKPTALTGFYKCNLVGVDSVYIVIDFTNNGNSVLSGTVTNYIEITSSTNTWTSFSISLGYSGNPDSAHIYVASNRSIAGNATLGNAGTILDVDHFVLITPTNIQEFGDYSILLSAYPNPANENFNIISKTNESNRAEVYDLSGRMIESRNFESDKININLNNYSPGLYI